MLTIHLEGIEKYNWDQFKCYLRDSEIPVTLLIDFFIKRCPCGFLWE